jgi:uncharacterized protein with HEPN domain
MPKRNTDQRFDNTLGAAERILLYICGLSSEEFYNDNKNVDTVIRDFEII